MAYWCDDRRHGEDQRRRDAEQARIYKVIMERNRSRPNGEQPNIAKGVMR